MAKAKKKLPKAASSSKTPAVEVVEAKARGRPSSYEPVFCQMLIKHNQEGLSFESFGAVVGVSRQTLYDWADAHPEFLDAKRRGQLELTKFYEQVVRNVAMGLVPNAPAGTLVTRGNATAAIYLLKVHGKQAGFQEDGTNRGMGFGEQGQSGKDTTVNFQYLDAPKPKTEGES